MVSFSMTELASELSWNCREEGPTTKSSVLERRLKQIRNFLFIWFVSLGVPILNMGDECGQSSGGRKLFDWNAVTTGFEIQITPFISFLSSLRISRSDLLQKRNFSKEKISNGMEATDHQERSLLQVPGNDTAGRQTRESNTEASQGMGDLFIAFNAAKHSKNVIVPPPPEGMAWHRLVDTALPFPRFFTTDGKPVLEQMVGLVTYEMKSHGCTLFEARDHGLRQTSKSIDL